MVTWCWYGIWKQKVGNNEVVNTVGTNREVTLNNNGKKLYVFANLIIQKQWTHFLSMYKFAWEARWHKSIINYLITQMKTSKIGLIHYTGIYISLELDSDHY
jgi:hypothetical protein